MNMCPGGSENMCKNGAKKHRPNGISFKRRKVPLESAFSGLFIWADSDKESSQVVGKFSRSGA